MNFFPPAQIGLLAEGFGDIIGPILIFGIYIIASIAKVAAKKGQSGNSGRETESELKKAVRRKYQEIHQKQVGQTPQQAPPVRQRQQQTRYQPKQVPKTEQTMAQQRTQWALQQEVIRERNSKLQSRKSAPKPLPLKMPAEVSAVLSRPMAKQMIHKKTMKAVEGVYKQPDNRLGSLIKGPENLRSAIILKEILDKPLALRDV